MPRTKVTSGYASIFISYSHGDAAWMDRFRRELKAALYNRATIWCDKDIDKGSRWEERLAREIAKADLALILASTEYLQSTWCRRELETICAKVKQGTGDKANQLGPRVHAKANPHKLKRLFWVALRPCAWKQTELGDFERSGDKALNEITDELERDREIVRIVEEISDTAHKLSASEQKALQAVKTLLGDEIFKRGLTVDNVISDQGEFTIVCRGRDGSRRDVAIKVMRRSPLTGILENLQSAAIRRQQLRDPGFINVYESFMVSTAYGDHLVLIMEYFEGKSLRKALADKELKHRFDTDGIVRLLRRAAEALNELHGIEYGRSRKRGELAEIGFGPMVPDHLFYDDRLNRVRFSAISISNYAWDVLGWRRFTMLVNNEFEGYAAPEQLDAERSAMKLDKRSIDQYMLGQLAVAMLDRKRSSARAPVRGDNEFERRRETLAEPLKYAGSWKDTHPQLARIISRMLAVDPKARWSAETGMSDIATELAHVESHRRALAKGSFLKWIENDERFFEEFYAHFFQSMKRNGVASIEKFKGIDRQQQNEKLRRGMAAVLNFRPGNEPTALRYVAHGHRKLGVSGVELQQFADSFLEVLGRRLNERIPRSDPMARRKEDIMEAWKALLEQVLDYFRKEGIAETPPARSMTPSPRKRHAAGSASVE
jgi:serine/threonine protein kinase